MMKIEIEQYVQINCEIFESRFRLRERIQTDEMHLLRDLGNRLSELIDNPQIKTIIITKNV